MARREPGCPGEALPERVRILSGQLEDQRLDAPGQPFHGCDLRVCGIGKVQQIKRIDDG